MSERQYVKFRCPMCKTEWHITDPAPGLMLTAQAACRKCKQPCERLPEKPAKRKILRINRAARPVSQTINPIHGPIVWILKEDHILLIRCADEIRAWKNSKHGSATMDCLIELLDEEVEDHS